MNLVLIGYRGTGKSTVARHLALALGWEWIDADVEVELAAGKSIAAIFTDDGEVRFRELESAVIADLARRDSIVLAAGGGAVLRPENCLALRSTGRVVWLTARPETIVERLASDPTTRERRPNLTTAGGEAEIRSLLESRRPLYAAAADLTVETDGRTPGEIAQEILSRLDLVRQ
jgi:shikimate kinase